MPDEKSMPLMVRLTPEQVRQIDDWRRAQADLPSRPETVRRLMQNALDADSGASAAKLSPPLPIHEQADYKELVAAWEEASEEDRKAFLRAIGYKPSKTGAPKSQS